MNLIVSLFSATENENITQSHMSRMSETKKTLFFSWCFVVEHPHSSLRQESEIAHVNSLSSCSSFCWFSGFCVFFASNLISELLSHRVSNLFEHLFYYVLYALTQFVGSYVTHASPSLLQSLFVCFVFNHKLKLRAINGCLSLIPIFVCCCCFFFHFMSFNEIYTKITAARYVIKRETFSRRHDHAHPKNWEKRKRFSFYLKKVNDDICHIEDRSYQTLTQWFSLSG